MLGYLDLPRAKGEGSADLLLSDLAQRLAHDGVRLAGAVQTRSPPRAGACPQMCLRLLHPGGTDVVISAPAAPGARGCRLDPAALEDGAQRALDGLAGAQLLLLSKFGRHEAAGGGFRTLIAEAMGAGIPALVILSPDAEAAFADFADGMAEAVAPDRAEAWCRAALAQAATVTASGSGSAQVGAG